MSIGYLFLLETTIVLGRQSLGTQPEISYKSERSAYKYDANVNMKRSGRFHWSSHSIVLRSCIPNEENAILRVHQAQVLCSFRPVRSSYGRSPVLGGNKLNKLLIDFLWHFWALPTLDMHSPHILGRLIPASREKCSTAE
jgi:hypothetical protein